MFIINNYIILLLFPACTCIYRGMSNFEEEEVDRAEYTGEQIHSFINGEVIKYFPSSERDKRVMWSNFVITSMIMLVIACVAIIFYAKYYVTYDV